MHGMRGKLRNFWLRVFEWRALLNATLLRVASQKAKPVPSSSGPFSLKQPLFPAGQATRSSNLSPVRRDPIPRPHLRRHLHSNTTSYLCPHHWSRALSRTDISKHRLKQPFFRHLCHRSPKSTRPWRIRCLSPKGRCPVG